jgi:hypothetical protein
MKGTSPCNLPLSLYKGRIVLGAKWLIEAEMFNRTIDHRHTFDFKMFIGLDIGADFHLAACIPFDKVGEWKRQKTTISEANGKGIFSL